MVVQDKKGRTLRPRLGRICGSAPAGCEDSKVSWTCGRRAETDVAGTRVGRHEAVRMVAAEDVSPVRALVPAERTRRGLWLLVQVAVVVWLLLMSLPPRCLPRARAHSLVTNAKQSLSISDRPRVLPSFLRSAWLKQ